MKTTSILLFVAIFLLSSKAESQVKCPKELTDSGGVCLTKEQKEKIVESVKELKNIHESKAELEVEEPIVIIRDWEDRVYINGGDKKPVKLRLKIGEHVDRELEAVLPVSVYYRDKPPDPWFRLRIRAQVGILIPEFIESISNTDNLDSPWDAGIGWDFFHIPGYELNLAAYTGVRSAGGGVGIDLTKNFGIYSGYSFIYKGLSHSFQLAAYFSFN